MIGDRWEADLGETHNPHWFPYLHHNQRRYRLNIRFDTRDECLAFIDTNLTPPQDGTP